MIVSIDHNLRALVDRLEAAGYETHILLSYRSGLILGLEEAGRATTFKRGTARFYHLHPLDPRLQDVPDLAAAILADAKRPTTEGVHRCPNPQPV